jgi:hypothetical protein
MSQRSTSIAVLALAVLGACVQPPRSEPLPARLWPQAFLEARQAAEAGQFAAADSVLSRFARTYDRSAEAWESLYWRALLRLDPRNLAANPQDAIRALDAYLAEGDSLPRHGEVRILRRLAVRLDSLSQPPAAPAAAAAADPRDAEIERLKAELKKTVDELELIRRRLAQPRP